MLPWSQSSLLLVAHGSSRYPEAAEGLRRLAGMIRDQALFARVDLAFWRQDPILEPDQLIGPQVFILPFFAGLGKHTEQLIPERLGLTGALTDLDGKRLIYCQPVGCHPRLPDLILERSLTLCRDRSLTPDDTTLLLIGHGSTEGSASRTPEAIAAALRNRGRFARVTLLYLEQSPFASEWPGLVADGPVIAQPLLLSSGMHASDDLPPLFGMENAEDSPRDSHGHRVWLQQGIGDEASIMAMMLDQIVAAGPPS
jgi:sirohydrochlorin cobaltochelatase